MKGLSLYLSFGSNKGFGLQRDGPSIRFKAGKVSFCITLTDIEGILEKLLGELKDNDVKKTNYNSDIELIESQAYEIKQHEGTIKHQKADIDAKMKEIEALKKKLDKLEGKSDDLEDALYVECEDHKEELERLGCLLQKSKEDLVFQREYFLLREY